jgi:hypothetical protein
MTVTRSALRLSAVNDRLVADAEQLVAVPQEHFIAGDRFVSFATAGLL